MITVAAFMVVAAAGALARVEVGRRWNAHDGFPFGTLIVNVTGSLMLGLLGGAGVSPPALAVLGVGALGAYTTFSSFARDAVALATTKTLVTAALYVLLSCAFGIGAAAAGLALAS